jgi:hypothetical protein
MKGIGNAFAPAVKPFSQNGGRSQEKFVTLRDSIASTVPAHPLRTQKSPLSFLV